MEQDEIDACAAEIRRRAGLNYAAMVDGQMLGGDCDPLFVDFVCEASGYDREARDWLAKGQAANR